MTRVAGVDGCRGGWICVLRNVEPPHDEQAFLARSINEVLAHPANPEVIAIDIPIGLPERATVGGRDCDITIRVVLGKRSLAVFAVPARAVVAETDYRRACAVALATSIPPRQISQQMFHLFPKIREVDIVMTPTLQNRVYECHPEAAFWAMNGQNSLSEPKKIKNRMHVPGLEQRRELLMAQGFGEEFLRETKFRRADAGPDDFLDACACAWTAGRIAEGKAIRFPHRAPLDAKGLRMEILA
jgi:predicted RNase H-like nuclease